MPDAELKSYAFMVNFLTKREILRETLDSSEIVVKVVSIDHMYRLSEAGSKGNSCANLQERGAFVFPC